MSTAQEADALAETPLFSQVFFHIIESDSLPLEIAADISRSLTAKGAVEHAPSSRSGNVPLCGLTHIISCTIDFEAYEEAASKYINIVTPGWIKATLLKERLANPKSHSPDPRLFYSGLVVCTANLPEGDKDAIIGGVLAMGGLYSGSVSKLVTHIVALNMEPQACQLARAKGLRCKIVLPHWFDDCLRLGKRIDEGPYLLPDPAIMKRGHDGHITATIRPDLVGAVSAKAGPLPDHLGTSSSAREQLDVFQDKVVLLGTDLGITDHLRKTIEMIIQQGHGKVTSSVTDAHVLICQYRDGDDFIAASISGKIVGNLPWLYHLFTTNKWTSPMKRLLHYPIARHGLPGVRDFRISLSNYNGEARVYLENLAKAAGCEFTKTMKQDNTHLITAHRLSEKCDAAREWNIHMVNHLWLEESYAKWHVQSVSNPRYTHFPSKTNLTEVVGQTSIDKEAVKRHFFAVHSRNQGDTKSAPPGTAADHKPVSEEQEASSNDYLTSKPRTSSKVEAVKPAAPTPRSRRNDPSTLKTPGIASKSIEDKENNTPSTSGSRSAKDRAMVRLHSLAPDIALYEKEMKRIGGVVFGGRRKEENSLSPSRKRTESLQDDPETSSEESAPVTKRLKQFKAPPQMRVLVTGYARWTEDPKLYSKERERLRSLGLLLTQDYKKCAYLVAPKILRTQKFCCAVAQSPKIMSTRYLEDCIAQNTLLDPDLYLLEDYDGETRYGLKLTEVINRASANKGRLLKGQTIWITEGIHGGFESYKPIVETNGGKCALYRGRPFSNTATVAVDCGDEEADDSQSVFLVSGPTRNESKLWPKFCHMAKASGAEPRIVRTDWILDLALSQRSQWKDSYELTEADVVNQGQAV